MQECESIILTNTIETAQIDGFGSITQEVLLKLHLHGLIEQDEQRRFLIQINMQIKDITYQYANVFTKESMDSEGYISVGTVYVKGPVNESDIKYSGTLTFIKTE